MLKTKSHMTDINYMTTNCVFFFGGRRMDGRTDGRIWWKLADLNGICRWGWIRWKWRGRALFPAAEAPLQLHIGILLPVAARFCPF